MKVMDSADKRCLAAERIEWVAIVSPVSLFSGQGEALKAKCFVFQIFF